MVLTRQRIQCGPHRTENTASRDRDYSVVLTSLVKTSSFFLSAAYSWSSSSLRLHCCRERQTAGRANRMSRLSLVLGRGLNLCFCTADTALHYRHCTALHCTALHCTALHCTEPHCTALLSGPPDIPEEDSNDCSDTVTGPWQTRQVGGNVQTLAT